MQTAPHTKNYPPNIKAGEKTSYNIGSLESDFISHLIQRVLIFCTIPFNTELSRTAICV